MSPARPLMVSDKDIYRSANILIRQHGSDAVMHAALFQIGARHTASAAAITKSSCSDAPPYVEFPADVIVTLKS